MMGNNENKEVFDDYKKYVNKLGKEYEDIFKKIEIYINGTTKINSTEKNDCLLQIIDTFLSAQEQGRTASEITGSNLKKYCESMIYGESLYIYKYLRIARTLIGTIFYITYMHFFIRIFKGIFSEGISIVFQPMNFGSGEVALGISNICIPIILSIVTQNYFEDPKRCKKIKRNMKYGAWIFALIIYTFLEDYFGRWGITISFSRIILILIFLTIVSIDLFILFKDTRLILNSSEKRDEKYGEFLIKKYEKYKVKYEKKNRELLEWDNFILSEKRKDIFKKIYFSTCGIIIFALGIFLSIEIFIHGNIDPVGIIILVLINFLCMFIFEMMTSNPRQTVRKQ